MIAKREMTCIACPMGCRMNVWRDETGKVQVENHTCKRGVTYGVQEFENPMRTVTSLVRIQSGMRSVCAVKTKSVVPKAKIPEILEIIRTVKAVAPVAIGQVVAADIAGTGVDLVATANMAGEMETSGDAAP